MDSVSEIKVTPSMIRKMLPSGSTVGIGDDFLISRQIDSPDASQLKYPFRIESYLAAFCLEGEVTCSVNLTEYTLRPGMMLVISPGNVVCISNSLSQSGTSKPKYTIISVVPEFMQGISFNLTGLFSEILNVFKNPCITLTKQEEVLLHGYVDIAYSIIGSSSRYVRESVSALATSIFYQFASFLDGKDQTIDASLAFGKGSQRHKIMFEQFFKLVHEYHYSERLVGFYADKLCVTPKYLSKVVAQVSGRTAPEWINERVILTAKHLLRHSDLSIKEIAARLNFASQSFFFRFFKQHTGQTPNQFRQNV